MPIGYPSVPYKLPGEQYTQWVNIYTRLARDRIIFLGEEVNDQIANEIIAIMLYLDSEDPGKDIFLYINSPGGVVTSGLAIYDTMQHIKSDVVTICLGLAASMGSFLLAGGTKGKRLALPHSRIMIHQPSGGTRGQATRSEEHTSELQSPDHLVCRLLLEKKKQKNLSINAVIRRRQLTFIPSQALDE